MDICTRKLLVEGPSREWLYPWPSSHPPSAGTAPYVGEKAPTDQWHCQLGHLAPLS
jgi:hypothetical protein